MKFMQSYEKMAKIAINKSILKEYSNQNDDRIVYLEDGSEFQVQLFNPYDYVIGVSVNLNVDIYNISHDNLIVLKPGQRVWLERYVDKPKKFAFSTYEVGTSQEVKNAISKNGNVVIAFFKEKEKDENINISKNWYAYSNDDLNRKISIDIPKTIDTYYTTSATATNGVDNARFLSTCLGNNCTSASISTYASTIEASSVRSAAPTRQHIETGRVEAGSHSDQSFTYTDYVFESWPFKKEVIKLLPKSRKPTYAEDLVKRYCTGCGHKINPKFKYCPYCGARV